MVTRYVESDLRVYNGQTLYMPPWEAGNDKWGNLTLPDVYAISTAQLYPTGTIFRKGIRTFIYTKTEGSYFGTGGGGSVLGAGYCMESHAEFVYKTDAVVSGAADQNVIGVTTSDSVLVNAYAGGFIGIKQAAGGMSTIGRYSSYQIISNTVEASNVTYFTLDGNLVNAYGSGDDVVFCEHPYATIRAPQSAMYGMCVGINIVSTQASKYLWLQTGGPCAMLSALATYEGGEPNAIPVYAIAGVPQVSPGTATGTANAGGVDVGSLQCIGYSMPSTDIGGPVGTPADVRTSPIVFLTIFN